jgi:hypothetical protein
LTLATQSLVEMSYTPSGLASLMGDEARRRRMLLDERQDREEGGRMLEALEIELEEDELLGQAVNTDLVAPINRKTLMRVLRGAEPAEPGNLRMPLPLLRQFDQMLGDAYIDRLRTFGIYFHGYVNRTCENSLATWLRVNGLIRTTRVSVDENDREYVEYLPTETSDGHPFTGEGVVFVPAFVARQLNLDDDGEVESVSDGASTLAVYRMLCEQAGLPAPNVLTA